MIKNCPLLKRGALHLISLSSPFIGTCQPRRAKLVKIIRLWIQITLNTNGLARLLGPFTKARDTLVLISRFARYRVARLDRIVGNTFEMADKSLCLFDVASLKLVSMQLQGSLNKISGISKSAVATCFIFIVQS